MFVQEITQSYIGRFPWNMASWWISDVSRGFFMEASTFKEFKRKSSSTYNGNSEARPFV